MAEQTSSKTAAQWLEVGIKYEAAGNEKMAELALKRATIIDEREHAEDAKTASLPRK